MTYLNFCLTIVMSVCLASCGYMLRPHDNFKHIMQAQVGKKRYDQSLLLVRYPEDVVGRIFLLNGNIEDEFKLNNDCRVFFEIDNITRIVISWRYEEHNNRCRIIP